MLPDQTFGEITGEARDSTGAVITTATAAVTNQATGASRIVVTVDSAHRSHLDGRGLFT